MKFTYKVALFPEHEALIELKKRICDYAKQLQILHPTLNDPHITIKVDFEYEGDKIKEVEESLRKLSNDWYKFNVKIKKIDTYPKREFHYAISFSKELKKMHMDIISTLGKDCLVEPREIEGSHFNFVIPIIFGDLHKDDYDKAAKLLEDYYPDLEFEIDNITLLRKEGLFWKEQKRFPLLYK
jgi:2'-5' RNA ligase